MTGWKAKRSPSAVGQSIGDSSAAARAAWAHAILLAALICGCGSRVSEPARPSDLPRGERSAANDPAIANEAPAITSIDVFVERVREMVLATDEIVALDPDVLYRTIRPHALAVQGARNACDSWNMEPWSCEFLDDWAAPLQDGGRHRNVETEWVHMLARLERFLANVDVGKTESSSRAPCFASGLRLWLAARRADADLRWLSSLEPLSAERVGTIEQLLDRLQHAQGRETELDELELRDAEEALAANAPSLELALGETLDDGPAPPPSRRMIERDLERYRERIRAVAVVHTFGEPLAGDDWLIAPEAAVARTHHILDETRDWTIGSIGDAPSPAMVLRHAERCPTRASVSQQRSTVPQ